MPEQARQFDVVVLGAGPAGLVAAIRLLQFGHTVGLVEAQPFPRFQIGESLSPGIAGMLDYLGLSHILEEECFIPGLPSIVAWDSRQSLLRNTGGKGASWMVDRGLFDARLLAAAQQKGLVVFQPDKMAKQVWQDGTWHLQLRSGMRLEAKWLVDARGRKALQNHERVKASPASMAIWSDEVEGQFPKATCIEALEDGWIWASPLCNGGQRIMTFVSPSQLKSQSLEKLWSQMVDASEILKGSGWKLPQTELQTCLVATYCHESPWEDGLLRVGEAAFSLDPLSSTGVEKAMRFALQSAVALNTILKSGRMDLAKEFHAEKLLDAVATHSVWTADFYANAWPKTAFWQERSIAFSEGEIEGKALSKAIFARMDKLRRQKRPEPMDLQALTMQNWERAAIWSPDIAWRPHACVVGQELEAIMALEHPRLPRPVAFLGEQPLHALHTLRPQGGSLAELVHSWSKNMPVEMAQSIVGQLLQDGILEFRP